LDLTAGYGGHASEVKSLTGSAMTLVDRDNNAISELSNRFGGHSDVTVLHSDFLQACRDLVQANEKFDCILVDLGVSSPHLDNADRGFSLKVEAPLDMRMDTRQELTAADVVNTYAEDELVRILRSYGEEPKAFKMARAIEAARPLGTTIQLADVAKKVWPGHSRTHPATRLFQAVRIEVNNELGQLEEALPLLVELLPPKGRLAVISFHSLEDRIVKKFYQSRAGDRYDSDLEVVNRRVLTASETELVTNPRARSAKLRVAKRK
jgi:16S rRNA (cytosine1402-N4)-methyltransferase